MTARSKKCSAIRKGLRQKGQAISDKNEIAAKMLQEKRELALIVTQMKKEIVQTQKSVKVIKDNNWQIGDDIAKLSGLVGQKAARNEKLDKDLALVKRDIKALHSDCESLKQERESLEYKIEGESQLIDVVQRLIVNLKKQINDVRRDKERLQISVRGEQKRMMEVINKRKTMINEESEKIYYDFKETMNHTTLQNQTIN